MKNTPNLNMALEVFGIFHKTKLGEIEIGEDPVRIS